MVVQIDEDRLKLLGQRPIGNVLGLLREVADASPSRASHLAGVGGDLTGEDAKERRFAGAVDADESRLLPGLQAEGDSLKECPPGVSFGKFGDA